MMPEWELPNYTTWETDTNYDYGDLVTPNNDYVYKVVTGEGGTSGTEPTWPTNLGDRVTDDNGLEYECWRYKDRHSPKDKAETFAIPVPYELPEAYYGFFEINGPLTGSQRHHMTPNKLSIGGTKERLLADTLWEGSGGRYPSDDSIGIQGKVWRTEVYGFYILWGLRWIDLVRAYIPFGHAKVFPVQPKVELKQVSPNPDAEAVSPSQGIRIIKNPRSG